MRITKVTTKTGDSGQTRLGTGALVSKSDEIIQALGEIDELNTVLGWMMVTLSDSFLLAECEKIQQDLFNLGGEISLQGEKALLSRDRIQDLEGQIERMNDTLPPLEEFLIPGGDESSARIHITRAVCRRGERAVAALEKTLPRRDLWIQYLNRLSDWFFVAARLRAQKSGAGEAQWQH